MQYLKAECAWIQEHLTVNLFSPYLPEAKLAAQDFFVILK